MRRVQGSRPRLAVVAAAVALAVTWPGIGGGSTASAYPNRWIKGPCNADNGLWPDSPGRGAGLESAFGWVANVLASNEFCTWSSNVPGILTETYPQLRVAAAVNDGTELWLRVFNTGGVQIASTAAFPANSAFTTVAVALPPFHAVGRVELMVHDNPDAAVASGRSTVLVDDVRIWNPGSGMTGWSEDFSLPG